MEFFFSLFIDGIILLAKNNNNSNLPLYGVFIRGEGSQILEKFRVILHNM